MRGRRAEIDSASDALWDLTERLVRRGFENPGGGLGGLYGYGTWFENDTFMMHPFCWCEGPDCPWCLACDCADDAHRYFLKDGREVGCDEFWDAPADQQAWPLPVVPERQCKNCREPKWAAPNFYFKPTGVRVYWYKYIGRDMEISGGRMVGWDTILQASTVSLVNDPGTSQPNGAAYVRRPAR